MIEKFRGVLETEKNDAFTGPRHGEAKDEPHDVESTEGSIFLFQR